MVMGLPNAITTLCRRALRVKGTTSTKRPASRPSPSQRSAGQRRALQLGDDDDVGSELEGQVGRQGSRGQAAGR